MKKTILFLMILFMAYSSHSENNAHKRLMEYAHPTPKKKPQELSPAFLSSENKIPDFLNISTIEKDEEEFVFQMQNESSIAVNPVLPSNLIASSVDYRDNSSTWVYVSDDGGNTWRNINLGKPFEGWRSTNDPSVGFNSDGIGYLVYGGFGTEEDSLGNTLGENGVFFARTMDKGVTWEAHIPVILHRGKQTPDSTFEDKYYIEVDNSPDSEYFHDLYIPWKRVIDRDSSTQIVVSKSTNNGTDWTRPLPVSHRLPNSSEDTTYGQSFPLITTGPHGEVFLVWNHGIEHGVGFSASYDGGETWTEPRIIQNYKIFGVTRFLQGQGYRHSVKAKVRAETYPVIISDNTEGENRGTLYLTWAGDRIPNIYFSKSLDSGKTWTEPVIIHSDTTNDQFWQWMSIDPTTGDIAVMYFDSRNDPENLLVECYISYSNDGGETWTDRQISDEGSDLRLNPFTGNSFAGDYSGLAFYDGMLYPSWVDMRNAVTNIRDSDVFTAIVNVNAPMPVNNFEANVIPEEPEILELNWLPPNEYSFGQKLNDEDYQLRLWRNDEFYSELPGGTSAFTDSNLTPYSMYNYSIYAIADNDSSLIRIDSAYAGGVSSPDAPYISLIEGNANLQVRLEAFIPTKRADGITPLVNLNSIKLYRDDEFVSDFDAAVTDTGTTVELFNIAAQRGFYDYNISVVDKYKSIENESSKSNTVNIYTGENFLNLSENLENIPLPKYFRRGKWQVTDEIASEGEHSLSVAPFGQYLENQSDTLILFPFEIKDDLRKYYLHFMNIAEIHRSDIAKIEISFDEMKSWEELASYNENMYEYWQDGVVNANDWQYEIITIPLENHMDSERFFIRFRFESNGFAHSNGWYLDNIRVDAITLSTEENLIDNDLHIYPVPASDILTVRFEDIFYLNAANIKFINIFGNEISITDKIMQISRNELKINTSSLAPGTYFIQINGKNKIYRDKIQISR
jgi:hypothetical protein